MASEPRFAVLVLSGLSGAGKSTAAAALIAELARRGVPAALVEGDDFYRPAMRNQQGAPPRVTLSDGRERRDWDSPDAVDWEAFGRAVAERGAAFGLVIVPTFMPRLDLLRLPAGAAVRHVELSTRCQAVRGDVLIAQAGDEDEIALCCAARSRSKPAEAAAGDALMVREVVYPAYRRTMAAFPPEIRLCAYSCALAAGGPGAPPAPRDPERRPTALLVRELVLALRTVADV